MKETSRHELTGADGGAIQTEESNKVSAREHLRKFLTEALDKETH